MDQELFDKDVCDLLKKHQLPFAFLVVNSGEDLECLGYASEDLSSQAVVNALTTWFMDREEEVKKVISACVCDVGNESK